MSDKGSAAFVGLGVMGYPMAGHLAANGYTIRVYNRTSAKADQWAGKYEGSVHPTPAEAAQGADFVMTCVGNDDDLRSVVLGETGVFAGMKEGAVLVDHTTTSAVVARELAEEAARREAEAAEQELRERPPRTPKILDSRALLPRLHHLRSFPAAEKDTFQARKKEPGDRPL